MWSPGRWVAATGGENGWPPVRFVRVTRYVCRCSADAAATMELIGANARVNSKLPPAMSIRLSFILRPPCRSPFGSDLRAPGNLRVGRDRAVEMANLTKSYAGLGLLGLFAGTLAIFAVAPPIMYGARGYP